MYLLDLINEKTEALNQKAQLHQLAREWVEEKKDKLEQLPNADFIESYDGNCYFDFNYLPHDQVMKVVTTLACGRWKREPVGERINYSCEVRDKIFVRCYQGQPPPNCQIVYEEVEVPARPARTERRAKMVCRPVEHALPAQPVLEVAVVPDEIPF
jgi:hypothetical protein